MPFEPNVGDSLTIGVTRYQIADDPAAPGAPLRRVGQQSTVYQVRSADGSRYALKVFEPRFRTGRLAGLTERFTALSTLPGLQVCKRTILTPGGNADLLREYPDLTYAVLMPWVEWPTWADVLQAKSDASARITPAQSLHLARALADILTTLDEHGLAHCDLSASNVMLPGLRRSGDAWVETGEDMPVALVDVEQMYAPGIDRPAVPSAGSPGYLPRGATQMPWGPNADRFAGSVLLAEMLSASDEEVRESAWGESFFDPSEMQVEDERYKCLRLVMRERWGKRVSALFKHAWRGDPPTFGEWSVTLPQTAPPESAGVGPLDLKGNEAVITALIDLGRQLERDGQLNGALTAFRQAHSYTTTESSRGPEVMRRLRTLEARIAEETSPTAGGTGPAVIALPPQPAPAPKPYVMPVAPAAPTTEVEEVEKAAEPEAATPPAAPAEAPTVTPVPTPVEPPVAEEVALAAAPPAAPTFIPSAAPATSVPPAAPTPIPPAAPATSVPPAAPTPAPPVTPVMGVPPAAHVPTSPATPTTGRPPVQQAAAPTQGVPPATSQRVVSPPPPAWPETREEEEPRRHWSVIGCLAAVILGVALGGWLFYREVLPRRAPLGGAAPFPAAPAQITPGAARPGQGQGTFVPRRGGVISGTVTSQTPGAGRFGGRPGGVISGTVTSQTPGAGRLRGRPTGAPAGGPPPGAPAGTPPAGPPAGGPPPGMTPGSPPAGMLGQPPALEGTAMAPAGGPPSEGTAVAPAGGPAPAMGMTATLSAPAATTPAATGALLLGGEHVPQASPSAAPGVAATPAISRTRPLTRTQGAPTLAPTVAPTETPLPEPTLVPSPTPQASLSTGDKTTRSLDGAEMVAVPAGSFEMGTSDAEWPAVLATCKASGLNCQPSWVSNEQPTHTVTLSAFWIDRTEVTAASFAEFLNARGVNSPEGTPYVNLNVADVPITSTFASGQRQYLAKTGLEDDPVVRVYQSGADAYCQWAGARLPTEAEWEYAARGREDLLYPWGNEFNGTILNYWSTSDGYRATAPVDSYPEGASWVGAVDMAGNAAEWVADWFAPYTAAPVTDPQSPASGELRVVRGGSAYQSPFDVRSAARGAINPGDTNGGVGFRCAKSAG